MTTTDLPTLPCCRTCGQRPSAHYEDESPSTDAHYTYGCGCDEPFDLGCGATAQDALEHWAQTHACPTQVSIRFYVRATSIILALVSVLALASELLHPEPVVAEDTWLPHWRLFTILAAFGIGIVAELCHWLLETPAALAYETLPSRLANSPSSTARL